MSSPVTVFDVKMQVLQLAAEILHKPNLSSTADEVVEAARILEKYVTEGAVVTQKP